MVAASFASIVSAANGIAVIARRRLDGTQQRLALIGRGANRVAMTLEQPLPLQPLQARSSRALRGQEEVGTNMAGGAIALQIHVLRVADFFR